MQRTFTVQAKAVEKIANAAAAHGVPPQSLYQRVKLDSSVLLDPDNRIPFAQLVALYESAAELTGDDNFGLHLGQSINPSAFDVVGYCALNSPTLGAAFTRGRSLSLNLDRRRTPVNCRALHAAGSTHCQH